jgi:NIMA (never in mitosis gene a)-related kinase
MLRIILVLSSLHCLWLGSLLMSRKTYRLLILFELNILESWLQCQKKLGAGSFGKVYEGLYRGSQKVAYKVTRTHLSSDAIRETNILKTLHHPSIVRYIDVIHTSQHTLLVMELIDGDTMYNYINENYLSSDYWHACENMMIDVAYALSYLHEKNIVHADLKSDNILVRRSGKAVLSDFGLSTIIKNSETESGDSNRGTLENNA